MSIPNRDLGRMLRVIAILNAAEHSGLTPMPLAQLHTIAYLADALSPVWHLRILDPQLLKQQDGPMSPALQRDVDALVGRGVLIASDVRHIRGRAGAWRLDASYELHHEFAAPILRAMEEFESTASDVAFLREVVYAVSGVGNRLLDTTEVDASYSDPLIDVGGLLDLSSSATMPNRSTRVARRLGELISDRVHLSDAEQLHLYVRALIERLTHAA